MQDGQLFTWEALSAMGGASLLTFLFVAYTKTIIDRFIKWLPTDLYAAFVAWVILTVAQLALGDTATDWRVYVLAGANSFIVAAAAGQMQNKAISPPGRKGDADKS